MSVANESPHGGRQGASKIHDVVSNECSEVNIPRPLRCALPCWTRDHSRDTMDQAARVGLASRA